MHLKTFFFKAVVSTGSGWLVVPGSVCLLYDDVWNSQLLFHYCSLCRFSDLLSLTSLSVVFSPFVPVGTLKPSSGCLCQVQCCGRERLNRSFHVLQCEPHYTKFQSVCPFPSWQEAWRQAGMALRACILICKQQTEGYIGFVYLLSKTEALWK